MLLSIFWPKASLCQIEDFFVYLNVKTKEMFDKNGRDEPLKLNFKSSVIFYYIVNTSKLNPIIEFSEQKFSKRFRISQVF